MKRARPVARQANAVRVHVEVHAELLRLQLADRASGTLDTLQVGELEDVLDDLHNNLRTGCRKLRLFRDNEGGITSSAWELPKHL